MRNNLSEFESLFAKRKTARRPRGITEAAVNEALGQTSLEGIDDWWRGVGIITASPPLEGVSSLRWATFQDDCRKVLERARELRLLGWDVLSLFGAHKEKPFARFDCAGLAVLLNGNAIALLSSAVVTLTTSTGSTLSYRKRQAAENAVPAWELIARASKEMAG